MKTKILLFSALIFSPLFLIAQLNFQKTIGGIHNDFATSSMQTFDGGYILAGYTHSFGAGKNDGLILKTDMNGDTLWEKIYGDTGDDIFNSIVQTADSGYIACGTTTSFGNGGKDVWVVKINSSGTIQWSKTYGSVNDDEGSSIRQISNGGYIIGGSTSNRFYLVEISATGIITWGNLYGNVHAGIGSEAIQTNDGGFLLAGTYVNGAGNEDMAMLKVDNTGAIVWTKNYGAFMQDFAGFSSCVVQTPDHGYAFLGYSNSASANGAFYYYLIKTNSVGDTLWSKMYSANSSIEGMSLQQTSDGGFILGGNNLGNGPGIQNMLAIKTDSLGNPQWHEVYGGTGTDGCNQIIQTNDGGYFLAGFSNSFLVGVDSTDSYFVKTNSSGGTSCNADTALPGFGFFEAYTPIGSPTLTIQAVGTAVTVNPIISHGGIFTSLCTNVGIDNLSKNDDISIFPNPSSGIFYVEMNGNDFSSRSVGTEIEIYDVLGNVVFKSQMQNAKSEIDLSANAKGIYFYRIFNASKTIGSGKMIVQ